VNLFLIGFADAVAGGSGRTECLSGIVPNPGLPGTRRLVRPCDHRRQAREGPGRPAADPGPSQDRSAQLRLVHQSNAEKPISWIHRQREVDAGLYCGFRPIIPEGPSRSRSAIQSGLTAPHTPESLKWSRGQIRPVCNPPDWS